MKIDFNFPSGAKVTLAANGQTETIDLWSRAHKLFEGHAGRVNVLDAPLSNPSAGAAVARADGRTTLNLLDEAGPSEITAALAPGRKALVRTPARAQRRGHPSGEHYWLPVGPDDRFVCEPGQRHRKWYLSRSTTALTKAQIAANAGVAESVVTTAWLLTRPQYGGTPQTAIHADLFAMIRATLTADNQPGRSDHYLLERGHDYSTLVDCSGFAGEDELHPVLFGAWGTGTDPVIRLWSNFLMLPYCVVQDIRTIRHFGTSDHQSVQGWYGFATIYDHLDVGFTMNPSNTTFTTIRETTILAPWRDYPKPDRISADGKWIANGNHSPGIYSAGSDSLLIDSCLIDHAGWADGYDYNGDATKPMPVTKYSHAIYTDAILDQSIRDCLLSRAASCGVQLRTGVHLEGNLFVDNNLNAAVNSFDGSRQFNNVIDNVVFSAGYRRVAYEEGAYDWGYDVNGPQSAMVGNIIAHSANPDNPDEISKKPGAQKPVSTTAKLADDTQVWKWGSAIQNIAGLDPAALDQTTIQRFTGTKLGKTFGTIPELVAHAAAAPSIGALVRDGVRWTKARFGKPIPTRTTPASLVFQPDPRTEGFRWDNRWNWSTLDLPGAHVADSVDLAGNFVRFGNTNAGIAGLKSSGGTLDVVSGKLEIGTLTDAADMIIRKAGQAWIGGAAQALAVRATSGRLALTGQAANLALHAGGQAQVLLGPDCTVPAGKSLVVSGQRALVGWDGAGSAALAVKGTLEFRRGVVLQIDGGGMDKIRLVYMHIGGEVTGSISGFKGRVAAVERTTGRGGNFKVWLSDVSGTPQAGDVFAVFPARNTDGTNSPNTVTVTSVISQGIAPLQRFRSGAIGGGLTDPAVAPTITLAPGAQVVVPAGLSAGAYNLTGPGVTVVNQGATLPAGVSVTGGRLVLTV